MKTSAHVLLFTLLLAAPAWAATYYVDKNNLGGTCNNGNAGTLSSPRCSIVAGIQLLGPGDTLNIRAGVYEDSWSTAAQGTFPHGNDAGSTVVVQAYPGETVEWRSIPGCLWLGGAGPNDECAYPVKIMSAAERFIRFERIVFDGVDRSIESGAPSVGDDQTNINNNPTDIEFRDCEFRNYHGEMNVSGRRITFRGGSAHDWSDTSGFRHVWYVHRTEDLLIEHMDIYNTLNGYVLHHYHGFFTPDQYLRTIFRYNKVHNIGQDAVLFADAADGLVYGNVFYDIDVSAIAIGHSGAASNIRVYHNTIVNACRRDCAGPGMAAIYVQNGNNHIIQNNILWQNNGFDYAVLSGDATFTNNLQNNNPLFQGAASHDYHLTPNSPARGMGVGGTGVTTDFDGNPYPSPPDAGAYAYGATFSPILGTFYTSLPTNSPAGSDSRTCTEAQNISTPFATFGKALSCAAGGSTIFARGGVYPESIVTSSTPIAAGSSWNAPTTVASYAGETATLQRTSAGAIIELNNPSTDQYLVFDRLGLDGVDTAGTYGFQVGAGAQHIRFQQGEIKRIANNAAYLGGATTEVLGSQLHDNTTSGSLIVALGDGNVIRGNNLFNSVSAGVFMVGATNTLVEGNFIRQNAARGLRAQNGSGNKVFNNLIYSNTGNGIDVESGESGVLLYHNTVWGNTGTGLNIFAGASNTAYTNNIFMQNGANTPSNAGSGTIATTNVLGDPSFIAPGPPTTFHVEGANVVHQGTTLAAVTTDLAGKGRSTPPGYTIGAYQDDVVNTGPQPSGPQLAFPTAEGYGRFSKGGRGGHAYNINSRNTGFGSGGSCNAGGCGGSPPFSSGTVTLYDCLADRFGVGARTCIFRVGGLFDLPGSYNVPEPGGVGGSITIAGQTAPGDGVMIKNLTLHFTTIGAGTYAADIIIRHVRIRPSETVASRKDSSCIEFSWNQDVMIDHVSVGWNGDDCLAGVNSDRVTIQWSLASEGILTPPPDDNFEPSKIALWTPYDHAFFGGEGRVSYLHNYFVDYATRAPLVGGGHAQLVNNLWYNFQSSGFTYPIYENTPAHMEWINNYFRPGPDSPLNELGNPYPLVETVGCGRPFIYCDSANASTLFMSGNLHTLLRPTLGSAGEYVIHNNLGDPITVNPAPLIPAIASQTLAADVPASVLPKAGAYAVAGGIATVRRDSIDQRAVTHYNTGTGWGGDADNVAAYGGYPSYADGTPYPDADGDGIADAWETAHGLNPNSAGDGPDIAANGYSNLENFLNELAGDPIAPVVQLTATPTSIAVGNSSTLSWTSTGATSCSAPWTGSTATSGSQSVSPTVTTTYTITCTDGTTPVSSTATVTVAATPGVSLIATPPSITLGGTSTLSWTSSNVTACSAPWTGSTATSGSQSVSPTVTSTYTITCTPGPVSSTATVTVTGGVTPAVRGLPYSSSMFLVIQ